MANISRTSKKAAAGLPTKEQLLLSPQNTDKMLGTANDPVTGEPTMDVAVTEGEYVISIPAIIGLGDGDYDTGLKMLEEIHQELKAYGEELMGGNQGDPQFSQGLAQLQ